MFKRIKKNKWNNSKMGRLHAYRVQRPRQAKYALNIALGCVKTWWENLTDTFLYAFSNQCQPNDNYSQRKTPRSTSGNTKKDRTALCETNVGSPSPPVSLRKTFHGVLQLRHCDPAGRLFNMKRHITVKFRRSRSWLKTWEEEYADVELILIN